jgi:hypothetical protein
MGLLNGSAAAMTAPVHAVVGAAREVEAACREIEICDLSEVEMAAAIGRLQATLTMLIAVVAGDHRCLDG